MLTRRSALSLLGSAAILPVAGCATVPTNDQIAAFITGVQNFVTGLCKVLPAAADLVALYVPFAGVVANAGHAICDAINKQAPALLQARSIPLTAARKGATAPGSCSVILVAGKPVNVCKVML